MNYRFTKTIESDPGMPFDIEAIELEPVDLWPAMAEALDNPAVVSIHIVKIREDNEDG